MSNRPARRIIREFCRSQGAPTAYWLGRLSAKGQRECIRQWIVKSRSPEITALLPKLADDLFDERTKDDPYFFDALSVEDPKERCDSARHHARERVDEEIRYGAIEMDEIDLPQPWVEYNQYKGLCDREWQVIVEEKATGFDAWGFSNFRGFTGYAWCYSSPSTGLTDFLGLLVSLNMDRSVWESQSP
jgi:hypothetical protein